MMNTRWMMVMVWAMLVATVGAGPVYELSAVDDQAFQRLAKKKLGEKGLTVERFDGCRVGRTVDHGYVLLTADYDQTRGYRGPTSVMLLLDPSLSQLLDVQLVESCDSPPYVKRALKKGLLSKLKGQLLDFEGHVVVDAVSGATRTRDAVNSVIEVSIAQLKKIEMKQKEKR